MLIDNEQSQVWCPTQGHFDRAHSCYKGSETGSVLLVTHTVSDNDNSLKYKSEDILYFYFYRQIL